MPKKKRSAPSGKFAKEAHRLKMQASRNRKAEQAVLATLLFASVDKEESVTHANASAPLPLPYVVVERDPTHVRIWDDEELLQWVNYSPKCDQDILSAGSFLCSKNTTQRSTCLHIERRLCSEPRRCEKHTSACRGQRSRTRGSSG
jgi:hypothetical protein